MYELLVVIHILAGIAWVGGGLTQQLAISQARQRGGSSEADRLLLAMGWMERFIYIPAPILVLLTGITMVAVNDGWSFFQLWVYVAIGLFVISGILGGAVGGKLEKTMAALREDGQVTSPAYSATLAKALNSGWYELALMVGIVTLMVYKPGA